MGDVAAVVAVCGELGMGVAHGFPVFVDGLTTVLIYSTLTPF